jgi:hypothetical protein
LRVRWIPLVVVGVLAVGVCGTVLARPAVDVLTLTTPGKLFIAGGPYGGVFARIGGSVDASFQGGEVDVKYQAVGVVCATAPSADTGRLPKTGAATTVAAGPTSIVTNGDTISLDPPAGSYRLCAWLVQAADGAVVASATTSFTVRANERPPPPPVRGWNPSTGACHSLHPAEVAAALGVHRVVFAGGGAQTGNQTPFELANASQCQWNTVPSYNPYLILFIQPESTRATLTRLLRISDGPALGSRDCPRLRGVGSDACAGGSNLYAVQGRLGLTFTMIGPPGTKPHSTTYTQGEEAILAREIFARVPFARR